MLEHEELYKFCSDDGEDRGEDWMRLDTTALQPQDAAEAIVERFGLHRVERGEAR